LVEPRSWNLDAEVEELPALDVAVETPWAAKPAFEAEPIESLPVPEPLSPVTPLATVTLAEIYVKQGHPAEAERIYREVLRREPANAAAQAGFDRLARMERRLRPLEARDLLADYQEPAESAAGGGHPSRLRHLLQSYVKRVRERSQRDVS
jgi:predicted Zn-dependent protease